MIHPDSATTRRSLLAAGSVAAFSSLLSSVHADAEDEKKENVTDTTALETENKELIAGLCEEIAHLDAEKIAPFIGDDIVFQLIDNQPPIKGRKAFLAGGKQFFAPFERAEFIIRRSYAIGNLVINLRDDHFYPKGGGDRTTFRVTGFFVIKEHKIVEWRDYAVPS